MAISTILAYAISCNKAASFISEMRILAPDTFVVLPGRRGSILFSRYRNTNVLALARVVVVKDKLNVCNF